MKEPFNEPEDVFYEVLRAKERNVYYRIRARFGVIEVDQGVVQKGVLTYGKTVHLIPVGGVFDGYLIHWALREKHFGLRRNESKIVKHKQFTEEQLAPLVDKFNELKNTGDEKGVLELAKQLFNLF